MKEGYLSTMIGLKTKNADGLSHHILIISYTFVVYDDFSKPKIKAVCVIPELIFAKYLFTSLIIKLIY